MKSILPSVAIALATAACVTAPADDHLMAIVNTIPVHYGFVSDDVVFSAHLPAQSTFEINVDGDQNGVWGEGPDSPQIENRPTDDLSFGRAEKKICSQYILSSMPEHPDRVYKSSYCGRAPSAASVEMTPPDKQNWMKLKIKIPIAELFGSHADAHLQVCEWDQFEWDCRYSPTAPFVLKRPDSSTR